MDEDPVLKTGGCKSLAGSIPVASAMSNYRFVDLDGDLLEVGYNYSFGYATITLFAEEGVRMTVADTEKLIKALQDVLEEVKS